MKIQYTESEKMRLLEEARRDADEYYKQVEEALCHNEGCCFACYKSDDGNTTRSFCWSYWGE